MAASRDRASGYKDIEGILYEVPEEKMMPLDEVEGVPEGIYYRQTIYVVTQEGTPLKACTYRTTNPDGPFKPFKKYIALMMRGAREHGLDPGYIERLEGIEIID